MGKYYHYPSLEAFQILNAPLYHLCARASSNWTSSRTAAPGFWEHWVVCTWVCFQSIWWLLIRVFGLPFWKLPRFYPGCKVFCSHLKWQVLSFLHICQGLLLNTATRGAVKWQVSHSGFNLHFHKDTKQFSFTSFPSAYLLGKNNYSNHLVCFSIMLPSCWPVEVNIL